MLLSQLLRDGGQQPCWAPRPACRMPRDTRPDTSCSTPALTQSIPERRIQPPALQGPALILALSPWLVPTAPTRMFHPGSRTQSHSPRGTAAGSGPRAAARPPGTPASAAGPSPCLVAPGGSAGPVEQTELQRGHDTHGHHLLQPGTEPQACTQLDRSGVLQACLGASDEWAPSKAVPPSLSRLLTMSSSRGG